MQVDPAWVQEPPPFQDALVAIADRLRRLATEILHQASAFGEALGARLEFVKLVARASVMREMIREKTRPPEAVHVGAVEDRPATGPATSP